MPEGLNGLYDIDLSKPNAYRTALSCARDNLTKPHILAYINELLEDMVLNEPCVKKKPLLLCKTDKNRLCQDKQLAAFFKVCTDTIVEWKKRYSEFSEFSDAVRKGLCKT